MLYSKLGREQIFDSLIERDQWINEEQRLEYTLSSALLKT